jgi:hypothetical protein
MPKASRPPIDRGRGLAAGGLPRLGQARQLADPLCATLWVPESLSSVLSCEFVGEAIGP